LPLLKFQPSYYLILHEVKVKAETLIAYNKIGEAYMKLNNKYDNGSKFDISTWAGLGNDMQDCSRNRAAKKLRNARLKPIRIRTCRFERCLITSILSTCITKQELHFIMQTCNS